MSYRPIAITQDILEAEPPRQEKPEQRIAPSPKAANNRGQAALNMAVDQVLRAPDGLKHKTLVKMSYLLGGYVAAGLLDEPDAESALQEAISKRANVDNLPAAYKAIKESLEKGKSKPVQEEHMDVARSKRDTPAPSRAAYQPAGQQESEGASPETIAEYLLASEIDFSEELAPPPVCLEIEQNGQTAIIGTRGNFSMVIGKAKSKKTFFVTMALAAAVCNGRVQEVLKGSLPEEKSLVLYFDTEQGKYHVQKAARRVLHMAGTMQPENFKAYGLRKFHPVDRLEIIEQALYKQPKVGLVVIDGIRDLISSINDEEQATMIASKLLKWTEELNIHIMCVLHQNKGDNNARGHVGTELQNKAETVLSITKDSNNKEISIVEAEYCREREFEPFAFDIDNFGIPQIVEDWNGNQGAEAGPKKPSYLPDTIPGDVHTAVLLCAFEDVEKLQRSQLLGKLKYALRKQSITIGDNKVKDYISYYLGEKLLLQEGTPGTKSSFYKLNLQPG